MTTGPSGAASMSKMTSRAGVSAESFRMRLSAGCSRICNASKASRPSISMTSSPSRTNRSAASEAQHCHYFWEISTERLARFGPQIDGLSSLEGETPKAIPFGFVLPGVRRLPGAAPRTSPPSAPFRAEAGNLPLASASSQVCGNGALWSWCGRRATMTRLLFQFRPQRQARRGRYRPRDGFARCSVCSVRDTPRSLAAGDTASVGFPVLSWRQP